MGKFRRGRRLLCVVKIVSDWGTGLVEGIKGGSVGVFGLIQKDRARTHTEPKSAFMRLMVSHG